MLTTLNYLEREWLDREFEFKQGAVSSVLLTSPRVVFCVFLSLKYLILVTYRYIKQNKEIGIELYLISTYRTPYVNHSTGFQLYTIATTMSLKITYSNTTVKEISAKKSNEMFS